MDCDSLINYLERQKVLTKTLQYPEKKQNKVVKELKQDTKRLKSKQTNEVEEITTKYLKTKPRIVELKRILCDCIFKFLSYFKSGTDTLWYDKKCGASLMERYPIISSKDMPCLPLVHFCLPGVRPTSTPRPDYRETGRTV